MNIEIRHRYANTEIRKWRSFEGLFVRPSEESIWISGLVARFDGKVRLIDSREYSSKCAVWNTEIQDYRDTGIQEYRNTGIQEYRHTGIQEYRNRLT